MNSKFRFVGEFDKLRIPKTNLTYMNADYGNNMFFHNNNFLGERAEKMALYSLFCQTPTEVFLGDTVEKAETRVVPNLLDTVLSLDVGQELVAFVKYKDEKSDNGRSYGSVDLVNALKVELSRKEFVNRRVHETFSSPWIIVLIVVLAILAIAYLTLVLRYRAQRRKYLRRKRELAARRAARERSADPPLSVESTRRLAVFVDEEMQKRERKE